MISSKQLEIKKGGVAMVEMNDDKFLITTNKGEQFKADCVVNCLGFELNAKKYPLLLQMINANLLEKDLLMVRSKNPKIHLVGGLNIGKDFECTAVPDMLPSITKAVEKCLC